MDKIDWCTLFPEYVRNIYIGDCCKEHDETLSTHKFYKCLSGRLSKVEAILITLGGSIGAWIKYPIQMYRHL